MTRSLLVSTLLLFACGGEPPTPQAAPIVHDLVQGDAPPFVPPDGGGDPGAGPFPCQLADCNGPDQRDQYTDPAERSREHTHEDDGMQNAASKSR